MATMKLIGLANGEPTPIDGHYVVRYDPALPPSDPESGLKCLLDTTPDRYEALHAPVGELFALWNKQHGFRFDGNPNKPITAFTVEIE